MFFVARNAGAALTFLTHPDGDADAHLWSTSPCHQASADLIFRTLCIR
ncbi:hypothetical protein STIAU_6078 [Stigmatella aurantiaca DW4/3-1]|uniref:Uncharacterized protein n=1 Tax=Stigmatella aurantiaca (strain DW4/3-1) TaxID=378806 RepID=Q08QM2_STIAD|nr:hypothetical protein STIAU_6078 [Stigmatella aurantiaca DW4/3-1]